MTDCCGKRAGYVAWCDGACLTGTPTGLCEIHKDYFDADDTPAFNTLLRELVTEGRTILTVDR